METYIKLTRDVVTSWVTNDARTDSKTTSDAAVNVPDIVAVYAEGPGTVVALRGAAGLYVRESVDEVMARIKEARMPPLDAVRAPSTTRPIILTMTRWDELSEAEKTYSGCHLSLSSLEADDVCPQCECPAREHRGWVETMKRRGRL